ncbi:hypothetical protein ACWNX2_00115 [Candidatus Vidania fulgoroideorum]
MIRTFIRDQLIHHTNVIVGILQYNNKRLPILIAKNIEIQLQQHKTTIQIQLGSIQLHTYIEHYEKQILNNKLKHIVLTSSHKPRNYLIKIKYHNYLKSDLFKIKKKSLYTNIKALKIKANTTTQVPSYIQLNTLKIKTPLKIKHLYPLIPHILNFKTLKNTPLFTF